MIPLVGILVGGIPAARLPCRPGGLVSRTPRRRPCWPRRPAGDRGRRRAADRRPPHRARRADDRRGRRPPRLRALRSGWRRVRSGPRRDRPSPPSTPPGGLRSRRRETSTRGRRGLRRVRRRRAATTGVTAGGGARWRCVRAPRPRLVDPPHRVDERFGPVAGTAHETVAGGPGEHAETAAQLVGEVPAQLAAMPLLEQLAPAAALAEAGDAGVELGDLGGVPFAERRRWRGRCGRAVRRWRGHHGGAGAVEPGGELGEDLPALGEGGISGEESGPFEVAAGGGSGLCRRSSRRRHRRPAARRRRPRGPSGSRCALP